MLAGFDGFDPMRKANFYDVSLNSEVTDDRLEKINHAFSKKISQLRRNIEIKFVTTSIYGGEKNGL